MHSISEESVSNDSAASDMRVNSDDYNICDVADTTREFDISAVSDLFVFNVSEISDDCSDSAESPVLVTSGVSVSHESNDSDTFDSCAAAISTNVASD